MSALLDFPNFLDDVEATLPRIGSPQLRELIVVDLFCGAGGASQGLLRALARLGLTASELRRRGWRLRLINVNHWEVAIETIRTNIAFADMYNASIENVDPSYVLKGARPHLLIAAAECFVAGTTILTKRGLVPIEDVRIGDLVLTHKGRWKPVTATMTRTAETTVLRGHGHYGLETTAEHPFMASTKTRIWNNEQRRYDYFFSKGSWTKVKDLQPGSSFWATPTKFAKVAIPPIGDTKRPITLDNDFWWLIGRWLGDGSVGFNNRTGTVTICCGKHEGDDLANKLSRIGALRFRRRDIRTATLFEVRHLALARWLVEHFGKLAHGKTIPAWVLSMKQAARRALLEGYVSADGSQNTRNERSCQTVSKRLAVGARLLAESLGYHATLYRYDNLKCNTIEGRRVNILPQYRVAWYEQQEKFNNTAAFDGYLWHRIREKVPGNARARVYNFEVADDNSYIADGIVVHNCIMFSQARGNKPIRDQSRTTAAWILDWVKCNPYALYFENVPEWRTWGALDEQMKPLPEHKGEYYRAFLSDIRAHGYGLAEGIVNCADHGDATTRKRLFILGLKDAEYVSMPDPTHTRYPHRFPGRKKWVAARDIIDWTRKGEPITHRKRGPHAVPTLRRIRVGYDKQKVVLRPLLLELIDRFMPIANAFHTELEARHSEKTLGRKLTATERRFNSALLERAKAKATAAVDRAYQTPLGVLRKDDLTEEQQLAMAIVLGQHGGAVARPASEPAPTIAGGGAIGFAAPAIGDGMLVRANASSSSCFDDATQALTEPMRTIVTKDCRALAEPTLAVVRHGENDLRAPKIDNPLDTITGKGSTMLAEPVIAHVYGVDGRRGLETSPIDDPIGTVCAGGKHEALAEPVIAQLYSSNVESGGTDSIHDPLATITAGGIHHALAEPTIASIHGIKADTNRCRSSNEPLGAVAGRPQHALAAPIITSRHNAERGRVARAIDEPTFTATGRGAGFLAEPTIVQQQGQSTAKPTSEPAPTLTAHANHLAVSEAFLVPQHGFSPPRSLELPTPTATAIARIGLADTQITSNHYNNNGTTACDPVPSLTTASGGGLGVADGFLVPHFGERGNQTPRTHSLNEPAPAVTSHGAGALIDVTLPENGPYFIYEGVTIYLNILYRMLHSSELANAHSFGDIKFAGTEADAVKQIGNSIPVNTAAAMIGHVLFPVLAAFEDLALAA